MRYILKFSLLVTFTSFTLVWAQGTENVLLTINRQDNGEINYLYLKTNPENQLSKIYLDLPGPIKTYDASDIRKGTGIYFQRGIPIIFLKSSDLDVSLGGNITLRYLREYKIVGDNTYNTIPLTIGKGDNGDWALFKNGHKVKKALTYPYAWGIKKFIIE